jgi:hypothetical protein
VAIDAQYCEPQQSDHAWLPHSAIYDNWTQGGFACELLECLWSYPESETADAVSEQTLEQRFLKEAEQWDSETAHLSSPVQRFNHPSYIAVLGMAQDHRNEVITLMLRDLQQNRREWFSALSYLTHENPIQRKDSGNLNRMIEAWVRWGKLRGRL